jgi:hypothetical protein
MNPIAIRVDVAVARYVEHRVRERAAGRRTNAFAKQRLVCGQNDVADAKTISIENEHLNFLHEWARVHLLQRYRGQTGAVSFRLTAMLACRSVGRMIFMTGDPVTSLTRRAFPSLNQKSRSPGAVRSSCAAPSRKLLWRSPAAEGRPMSRCPFQPGWGVPSGLSVPTWISVPARTVL